MQHILDIIHALTPSVQASSDSPSVAGWNTIQDSMTKYDEATMKDFTDDIDTLLVFVGSVGLDKPKGYWY